MPRMEVVPPSDGVWRWCRRRLPRPLVMECIQLRSSAAASKGPSDSRSTEDSESISLSQAESWTRRNHVDQAEQP